MYDQHRFGTVIINLSRAWRTELDRRLLGMGFSQARWMVLLQLGRFQTAPTQRELAERIGIESPTLTRTLDALEAKKMIVRVPCTADKRVKKVQLTEDTKGLVQHIEQIAQQLKDEIMVGISEEEIIQGHRLHMRMLKNLEDASTR